MLSKQLATTTCRMRQNRRRCFGEQWWMDWYGGHGSWLHGRGSFWATHRVKAWWPIEVAEGKALCLAIKLAWVHDCQDVIFETDCLTIANKLSRGAIYFSNLDVVLANAMLLNKNSVSARWSHVLRDGNSISHYLTRFIPFGVQRYWKCHYSVAAYHYILMDYLSID